MLCQGPQSVVVGPLRFRLLAAKHWVGSEGAARQLWSCCCCCSCCSCWQGQQQLAAGCSGTPCGFLHRIHPGPHHAHCLATTSRRCCCRLRLALAEQHHNRALARRCKQHDMCFGGVIRASGFQQHVIQYQDLGSCCWGCLLSEAFSDMRRHVL